LEVHSSSYLEFATQLVHYSQLSLLKSFHANPKDYLALPTESGSTGALKHAHMILHAQKILSDPDSLKVFISPYEHHSNILPWVELFGGCL
jgi:selenocysteine lyase/cysteine desulfurase